MENDRFRDRGNQIIAEAPALLQSVRKILDGFDCGIFGRGVEGDGEPGWAMKVLPYLQALADAERILGRIEKGSS